MSQFANQEALLFQLLLQILGFGRGGSVLLKLQLCGINMNPTYRIVYARTSAVNALCLNSANDTVTSLYRVSRSKTA